MEKLLLMAVGGAGMNIAEHIKSQFDCVSIAVNSSNTVMKRGNFDMRLPIGDDLAEGGAFTVEQSRKAAQASRYAFQRALSGYKQLLIVAGIGGGTGSGAIPVIIELANALETRVIVAVCLPFAFEKERRETAMSALAELQTRACTLIVHDNEVDQQHFGRRDIPMVEFFALQAQCMAKTIQATLRVE